MADIDWSQFGEPESMPTVSEDAPTASATDAKESPKASHKSTRAIPGKMKLNDEKVITDAVTSLYTTIGMGVGVVDMECGSAIVQAAGACSEAWVDLARTNDAVRRALLTLTQTSAWTGVLVAHLPLIIAVSTHHVPAVRMMMGTPREEAPEEGETPERYDIHTGAPKW